jgi:hypothetical protein
MKFFQSLLLVWGERATGEGRSGRGGEREREREGGARGGMGQYRSVLALAFRKIKN